MSKGELNGDYFMTMPSASVLSHELKSPLAVIRQLTLMLNDLEITEQERREYLDHLLFTSERALKLTTDLSQSLNLQPSLFALEPVNPFAVCRVMSREAAPAERLYDRHIRWPRPRNNVLAVANSRLLERIISNFINNAIKYTEPNIPIVVGVKQAENVVRMSVRDYGPRVPSSEYKRLFGEIEMKKSIKTRPESSGLGIYLANQFAASMQSKIGLIRHRDGMTFFVDMPVSTQTSFI